MSRSRQLAAIMFTDIKGYTALMQQNEEKAIQARNKHRRIFNAATEKYNGKVLQYYGDGTLSIFDSAIDAVECGIEMQLGFLTEPALPVRIGIHTGDIIFNEEEIIGDSVNVASRIESLAVPGSVFVSDKVYDEIKNQQSIKTVRLKPFQLKNIAKPIEVYAIANEGLIVPPPEVIKGKTEPEPSSGPKHPSSQTPEPVKTNAPFLATKLFIPPLRPNAVLRPRLIQRLNRGISGKLTLISAPAGFGKTTIISEWLTHCDRPVTWLSLEEADSDPNRFLSYLIAALQKINSGFGEGALAKLHAPQPPPIESTLTVLINEIAAIPDYFLLILDDYHLIDSPIIDQALSFLLDHLPPQMHLVIITREDPNLPLARLRVRGQLTELRINDLRFTPAEAAGFFNEGMGLQLSEADIAKLENRTEGWIAGLQMAALSIQTRSNTASFIEAFTGSHHFIIDYLVEEVLQQQPEPISNFLLQTSILDRLCSSLCEAVTEQHHGKEMLETLERGNLFLIPLDDNRQWYRYHHLFAEVLQARLTKDQPDQVQSCHRRASQWYEQNHLPADAIRHALTGNVFERAASLLEKIWPSMDESFQTAAWLKWAKQLPEEIIQTRPVLIVGLGWAYLGEGQMETGAVYLQKAEELLKTKATTELIIVDEIQFKYLSGSIATARSYSAQALGDFSNSVKYARQALDLIPEEEHIRRGPAAALLGLAQWASGELESAHRTIEMAMDDFRIAGALQFAISGSYGLADIRMVQGRLRDAVHTYEKALQLVKKHTPPLLVGTADLHLGLGDLDREQGDLETAIQGIQKSEELGESLALPDWPSRLRLTKARLKEAQGELDQALDYLHEAEQFHYRSPMPNVQPIPAQKAKLWVKTGQLNKALNWAREHKLTAKDDPTFLNEFELLTLARIRIAQYEAEKADHFIQDAFQLLERLLHAAEAGDRFGSAIAIFIQQALAFSATGEQGKAIAALERALTLAAPEGFARIFLDEGQTMIQLLSKALKGGILPNYVSQLLALVNLENNLPKIKTKDVQPLIEPLSDRELEVLQLIAQGLSNREISQRLFLALSTVKGHNQKIFEKLDVQRRTEAVAKARELGVL